ncbi:MAG: ATP-binding protein [Chthoniobacterales bacterium]
MDEAVMVVAKALDVELTKVLELSEDETEFSLISGHGWDSGVIGSRHIRNSAESQAGFTLSSDSAVMVSDLTKEERFDAPSLLSEHNIRSGISVIIMGVSLDRHFGVFGAHSRVPRRFTSDEVDFVQRVSALITASLNRDRFESALEEADRRKDEFLAMLAHELRNPLTPLRFAVAALRGASNGNNDLANVGVMMERQIGHMVRLLDDLLDVSRVSMGRVELRRESVLISSVVREAVEAHTESIDSAGHTLTSHLPDDEIRVFGDKVRLVQVVSNLIHNASKFSDGPNTISVTVTPGEQVVEITVSDQGIGIDPQLLPRIFELFLQGDNSTSRSGGGLGIGLTLVRTLVEMHGGTIRVESEGANQGTRFIIRLPITVADGDTNATRDSSHGPIPPKRVLVIDDNNDALESTAMLLRGEGHDVRTASGGKAGLKVVKQYQPDVILLDLGMPELDGFAVAKAVRGSRELAKVVLIAMTGYGHEAALEQTEKSGFDLHLVKPVEPTLLLEAIGTERTPGRAPK